MKKIISVLLVILWMLLIFYLSNQNKLETNETTSIIYKIFGIKDDSLLILLLIRKSAHFIEYLILGLLVHNLLKQFNVSNINLCTILICIIYACTDEIHQLFIQGRECKIIDCIIDTLGSSLSIFILNIKQILNKNTTKNYKKVV